MNKCPDTICLLFIMLQFHLSLEKLRPHQTTGVHHLRGQTVLSFTTAHPIMIKMSHCRHSTTGPQQLCVWFYLIQLMHWPVTEHGDYDKTEIEPKFVYMVTQTMGCLSYVLLYFPPLTWHHCSTCDYLVSLSLQGSSDSELRGSSVELWLVFLFCPLWVWFWPRFFGRFSSATLSSASLSFSIYAHNSTYTLFLC